MRVFAALLAMIAVVALALNIGSRIPPDTVAMAAGVVLGAMTAIPISLFLGVVLARRQQPAPAALEDAPRTFAPQAAYQPAYQRAESYGSLGRDYPPLVIINPAAFQSAAQNAYPAARLDSAPLLSGRREFRVIGEEGA